MEDLIQIDALNVLFKEGEQSSDLYLLKTGRLLICTVQGTNVKAIARINPGEFIGELSFFDGNPRATHVLTLEDSTVLKLPRKEILDKLPFWFTEIGKSLTKKIRLLDHIVHDSHYKKMSLEDQRPLSIDEQRLILAAINK